MRRATLVEKQVLNVYKGISPFRPFETVVIIQVTRIGAINLCKPPIRLNPIGITVESKQQSDIEYPKNGKSDIEGPTIRN